MHQISGGGAGGHGALLLQQLQVQAEVHQAILDP